MANRRFNIQWTPGVNQSQSVNLSYDGSTFGVVIDSLSSATFNYTIEVAGDANNVSVKIGSHADGQDPVYSEICVVISGPSPVVLTPATNVRAEELLS